MRRFASIQLRWLRSTVVWSNVLIVCLAVGGAPGANPQAASPSAVDAGQVRIQAEAGDFEAQEAYGQLLESARRHAEAARWYRRAAEAGRPEAQYRLGLLNLRGGPAMSPDRPALPAQPGAGIYWLTQATQKDHAQAQLELGRCYRDGLGVSANPVEAYKWFILAGDDLNTARSERDRTALTLTVDQIEKAQARAQAFRAGDRSDPRIVIVTQADLAQTGPEPEAEPMATEALEAVSRPESTHKATTSVAGAADGESSSTAVEKKPAAKGSWWTEFLAARGRDDGFSQVQGLIVGLVAAGALAFLGIIAFVVKIALMQKRKPLPPHASPPPPLPSGPPPLVAASSAATSRT